ncbi:phosphotransferase [Micromonospora sp. NPDC050980]|uniref:phosphotransferase family protein n=1 Tax=Micromonospora sp. NPDC050980 TaxID=3155161 RepID=UPI00340566DD
MPSINPNYHGAEDSMIARSHEAPQTLLTELRQAREHGGEALSDSLASLGVRPLSGGMQNDLYRWTSPGGHDIVIKFYTKTDRRRAEREWAALNLLEPQHLGTVPVPLWLDPAEVEPAIGMTVLHGTPLIEAADRLHALRGLACTTMQLQAVPLSGLMAELPRIDSGEHYLVRLTQAWPELLEDQADDPLAPAMQQLLAAWHSSGDADVIMERAEPVLSRGDANMLNWLQTSDGAACVDFEYAGYSNQVFDAADHIEHISARDVPDEVWVNVLPDLGVTDAHRKQFAANQRTCALRWLAVLWKQRVRRRDEFTRQHERVDMLFGSSNPYA